MSGGVRIAEQVGAHGRTDAEPLTAAQQALVLGVLALVEFVVDQLCASARGAEREDLIGWGRDGATTAALRYDPAIGTRFSSYAHTYISGAILDALRREKAQGKIKHAASTSARGFLAEVPDTFLVIWDDEATNRARLDTLAVRLVAAMAAGVAAGSPSPEDAVGDAEDRGRAVGLLGRALAGMSGEERAIYRLRYVEGKRLEAIGAALGVAEITARRRHEALLDKLAAALHAGGITELPSLVDTTGEEDER